MVLPANKIHICVSCVTNDSLIMPTLTILLIYCWDVPRFRRVVVTQRDFKSPKLSDL